MPEVPKVKLFRQIIIGLICLLFLVSPVFSFAATTQLNLQMGPFPAPTNLTATVISFNQIDLNWSAVSIAISYKVYRDGFLVASPTTTSYSDTGVSPGITYSYTVSAVNIDGAESSQSSPVSITIPVGGGLILPPVSATGQGNIQQNLGGEVRRTFKSGKIVKVVFPSYSIKGTVVVSIEPKDKAEIIKTNPLPQNTQIVGDLVADFKALSDGKELEKFGGVVQITFTYTDKQVKEAGVDEKTLKIYWWDAGIWKPLQSRVDTLNNTIIAYTLHFTLFAVIGEVHVKPTIIEKIQQKIKEIAKKTKEIVVKILKIPSEKIFSKKAVPSSVQIPEKFKAGKEEIVPPTKELPKEEIVSPPKETLSEKEKVAPPDLLKECGRWLWQKITNLWQKIWPF